MVPPPVVIGLVLCDYVHVELGEPRKVSLIGTLGKLAVPAFPATPSFYVCIDLTGAVGEATMSVAVESLETGETLFTREAQIRFPGKLDVTRVSVRIRQCTFPQAGRYELRLLIDKELLAHRLFHVYQRQE